MKKTISIIGGGTAALVAAAFIDSKKYKITLYEQNNTLGNKFLVAGNGGLNLSHSEDILQLIQRYTPPTFLQNALSQFTNKDFTQWIESLGIATYVGTSKRIYPKQGIKPIEVLQAIIQSITTNNVEIVTNSTWIGWNNDALVFESGMHVKSDITIFALGGKSWEITGSNGKWLSVFNSQDIKTKEFKPSNCAYKVNWNSEFIRKHEGAPLKNIACLCNNISQKGEAVITKFGIEGNAVYALSPIIRQELTTQNKAIISIDYKPLVEESVLIEKCNKSKYSKISDILKNDIHLTSAQIDLLKLSITKEDYVNRTELAKHIKKIEIEILATDEIDKAISTVGGIQLEEVDSNFELVSKKNCFCIGEMLDWDAPTGGYLIQACASMAVYVARYLNAKA